MGLKGVNIDIILTDYLSAIHFFWYTLYRVPTEYVLYVHYIWCTNKRRVVGPLVHRGVSTAETDSVSL